MRPSFFNPAKKEEKPKPAKPVVLSEAAKEAKARRADPKEFPQALVKGEGEGRTTRIVLDPVELKEALAEGWSDPTK